MKKGAFILIACLFLNLQMQSKITVFTIGDSTMANKPTGSTEYGWGMLFPEFVNPDSVQISDNGYDGRSTKSFIDEGKWSVVLNQLQPGDFVLIQFGHNDEKMDATLHTDPSTTYRDNLTRFVNETRAKGAIPVLLTSIVRRCFDGLGNLADTHGAYPEAMRETARSLNVPLIDMELKTRYLENIAGVVGTREIHQWTPPTEIDNTHLCEFGAYSIARMVAEGIKEQRISIPLNLNPASFANATDNTFNLAKRFLSQDLQSSNIVLSGLSSVSGYSGLAAVVSSVQSDYNNGTYKSIEELNAAAISLRQAENSCRWTQTTPYDATFSIANPSFEEGGGWSSTASATVPISWNLDAALVSGDVQLKNTSANDGYYRYYVWGATGSVIDFYQDIILPAGQYTLKSALKLNSAGATKLYVKVGDVKRESASTGTWSAWGINSISFSVLSDNSKVRIGVSSTTSIMIDNFKLSKEGAVSVAVPLLNKQDENIEIVNCKGGVLVNSNDEHLNLKKIDIYSVTGLKVCSLNVEKDQLFIPLQKGTYIIGNRKVVVTL